MTHSLHRTGSSQSLANDFVLLITPALGINQKGAAAKMQQALDVILAAGPVNIGFYGMGSISSGLDPKRVREHLTDTSRLRCCFDDMERLRSALIDLQQLDLGLSVTVSGDIASILETAEEIGLTPHTANLSLGVFGRTERLPEQEILDASTMCGHGMISFALIRERVDALRSKSIDLEEAVHDLSRPCSCGIVNLTRIRAILLEMIQD